MGAAHTSAALNSPPAVHANPPCQPRSLTKRLRQWLQARQPASELQGRPAAGLLAEAPAARRVLFPRRCPCSHLVLHHQRCQVISHRPVLFPQGSMLRLHPRQVLRRAFKLGVLRRRRCLCLLQSRRCGRQARLAGRQRSAGRAWAGRKRAGKVWAGIAWAGHMAQAAWFNTTVNKHMAAASTVRCAAPGKRHAALPPPPPLAWPPRLRAAAPPPGRLPLQPLPRLVGPAQLAGSRAQHPGLPPCREPLPAQCCGPAGRPAGTSQPAKSALLTADGTSRGRHPGGS